MRGKVIIYLMVLFTVGLSVYSCGADRRGERVNRCQLVVKDTVKFEGLLAKGNIVSFSEGDGAATGLFDRNKIVGVWKNDPNHPQVIELDDPSAGFAGNVMGAHLKNDSILSVLFGNKIVEYDFVNNREINEVKWDIDKFFPLPPYGGILKGTKLNGKDAYVVRSYSLEESKRSPEFFKKTKGLSCVEIESGILSSIADFDENSVYREKIIPSQIHVIFDVSNDSVFYLRPFERNKIRVATCMGGNVRNIPLAAEHHTDFTFPNESQAADMMRLHQENSIYIGLVVKEDYVYTQYREAMMPQEVLSTAIEYNETFAERLSYVDVYDRYSGKVIQQSIAAPSCLFKLIDVTKYGDFIFTKMGRCTEDLEIYKCGIECL